MERRHVITADLGRMFRRAIGALLVVVVALVGTAATASAHPLGNFTVNRYARVELSTDVVRIHYVLDEAEIPAFQDRDAVRADRRSFTRDRLAAIGRGLRLTVDGTAVALQPVAHLLTEPAGQGGLPTLRLAATFEGRLPAGTSGAVDVTFADSNEPERIGWREIVVVARGDARLGRSTAPDADSSDELHHYPADLTRAPLDLRSASFRFTPGTVAVAAAPLRAAEAPERSGGGFTGLVDRQDLTPVVLAGMLLLAALFGAVHALAPGHGKTVMAAYLVGTRGRPRDALLLGTIVSAMHTASVLVLGVVLFRVSRDAAVDRVFPWLEVASGVLVGGLGLVLLRHRLVALAHRRHRHDHGNDHHHGHEHHHGPGGHHHDLPDDVPPLSRRGLVVLATAGGLFPSPSALVVLVSAFTLGRPALGLALVGAFSIGLAVTLTAVGLLLVLGKAAAGRRPWFGRALPALPVAGAAAITVVGAILALKGFSSAVG